jgi:hypothetical protein
LPIVHVVDGHEIGVCTQAPVARSHAGADALEHAAEAPDPRSPLHAVQAPPLQTGALPPQLALVLHCTHTFLFVSQNGVAPPHCASARHWTHLPAALHFGVAPPHCASLWQVDVHVLLVVLQKGVAPPHWAADVHCTHLFVEVLHTGVAPVQAAVSEALHWRHWPPTHAGSDAVGQGEGVLAPLSPVHVVHVSLVQTGFVPGHCEDVVQFTHWFVDGSQYGVAPVHALVFVALHATHAPAFGPDLRHAGFSAVHGKLVFWP